MQPSNGKRTFAHLWLGMRQHFQPHSKLLRERLLLQHGREIRGDRVDELLHLAGEVSLVALLQLRDAPVTYANLASAVGRAALARKA
jgi:hypothetical protein